ncbi:branched-chain amino acid transport system II carrier protein [Bifidobacterium oedipodis]|uniref:Branched-chain amino acid transporter n=1 Tax=Bifidobacterium oedipodis TaxID=2675322 RepID=A0A7Y0EQU9_9BIFI|nr:branched-chain amino acid transport system II carrier protein [Bifidobacterium sp. DSM 109957]NMM94303.1 branched-chain amino acid transporter [Bifidobacterium sp. DSM 109957]
MTVTFFSMFFGAGNLIFPAFVGAQAGIATPAAALGFIVSAVGLPVLGVLAVSSAGGFEQLANRVSQRFSLVLGLAIILTIGPCFAIPRTATTSFEMAVVPFSSGTGIPTWVWQLAYSLLFFALSYVVAQHPEKLSNALGKVMGPLLIALIVVLFISCVAIGGSSPTAPMGDYGDNQMARGFLDGYQTMDLLAALYFGIVISVNISQLGVDSPAQNRRETGYAGLGTGVLLVVIYAALSYVGVVSGSITTVDPAHDTGATVLTNLTQTMFGPVGTAFVGLVFIIACFNVCTGLISTCGTYFQRHFPRMAGLRMTYRIWSAVFAVFSFVVSNAGLSAIIKVSVPVLAALYPIAITLVALALVHRVFSVHFPRVYFWTVLCVGLTALLDCIASLADVFGGSLPWLDTALAYLPLHQFQLGWLLPAVIGLIIGIVHSRISPMPNTVGMAE